MRTLNRQRSCEYDASDLRSKANRCRKLAETYRDRGQTYEAEILEVEASHKKRLAELRDQDYDLIQKEIEDREMLRLTGGE